MATSVFSYLPGFNLPFSSTVSSMMAPPYPPKALTMNLPSKRSASQMGGENSTEPAKRLRIIQPCTTAQRVQKQLLNKKKALRASKRIAASAIFRNSLSFIQMAVTWSCEMATIPSALQSNCGVAASMRPEAVLMVTPVQVATTSLALAQATVGDHDMEGLATVRISLSECMEPESSPEPLPIVTTMSSPHSTDNIFSPHISEPQTEDFVPSDEYNPQAAMTCREEARIAFNTELQQRKEKDIDDRYYARWCLSVIEAGELVYDPMRVDSEVAKSRWADQPRSSQRGNLLPQKPSSFASKPTEDNEYYLNELDQIFEAPHAVFSEDSERTIPSEADIILMLRLAEKMTKEAGDEDIAWSLPAYKPEPELHEPIRGIASGPRKSLFGRRLTDKSSTSSRVGPYARPGRGQPTPDKFSQSETDFGFGEDVNAMMKLLLLSE